jgi:SAM-dependent methyltransferase
MTHFEYIGSELDLFAEVSNWKYYWSGRIRPYINGEVIEIGAGIGSNTPFLKLSKDVHWTCLEPDPHLVARLEENIRKETSTKNCEIVCGTLSDICEEKRFDTIIYIDVLEHIQNDEEELELAATRLRHDGCIIVLSPAHQRLFTPFDAAIGHFRRYNKSMLRKITPPGARLEMAMYLDVAGLALSSANLLVLRQSMPTLHQLAFWDKWVIPFSRILDPLLLNSIGKTIVAVWRKGS